MIDGADKYKVREYVKKKGLGDILVPLIGHWDKPEDIDWDSLPDKFVLKCNHGCAYNILCNDKNKFDKVEATKRLKKWMKEDFGAFNIETHYSQIKPHITCEEFLGDCIVDYKFFCFNGEPKYIYVSSDLIHDREAQIGLERMTRHHTMALLKCMNGIQIMAGLKCRMLGFIRKIIMPMNYKIQRQ